MNADKPAASLNAGMTTQPFKMLIERARDER
jgi:hypothetical protein